nr:TonB-dependent receptor plug domain-containing protein [Veillonella denticariosi]
MKAFKHQKLAAYVAMILVSGCMFTVPGVQGEEPDDVKETHTVVVTATRSEQELSKVPASVAVVSGDDVRERHATNMNEALRIAPGVDINTYGGGVGYTNSNVFRINGSNQVLYMVDGINMNAAGGVNPPMTILKNMEGIERIEVLRGGRRPHCTGPVL